MKKLIISCAVLAGLLAAPRSQGQIIGPSTTGCFTPTTFTTTVNAMTYHWDFNTTYASMVPGPLPPLMSLIGPGSPSPAPLNVPSYGCFVQGNPGPDAPNYYYYVNEYNTGNMWCYTYGPGGPLTPPLSKVLAGTFPGSLLEGIDLATDGVNWYGLAVNSTSLIEMYFGSTLGGAPLLVNIVPNPSFWPHQLTIKFFDNSWHAFIADRNGTLDRLDFGPGIGSLMTPPLFTSLPNVGGVVNPCNFTLYQQGPNWYALISNLINNTITLYNFGTDLINVPAGIPEPPSGGLLSLPRAISIYPDCLGDLIALQINETGHIIELTFPGGDINKPCTYTDLGPTGGSTLGSGSPCAVNNAYYYLLPEFGSGDVKMYAPFIPLPGTAYDDYNWLSQNTSFSSSGLYDISLFYDMGRPSGPSLACGQVQVNCQTPCYNPANTMMTVTESTVNPCTYTACVGVGTANTIIGFTWDIEPGGVVVTDPTSSNTDCFTFSTTPGTVYTVTVTAHIVDANLNCCTATLTDTVSCGDATGAPQMPMHATGTGNITEPSGSIEVYPNPAADIVTVVSAKEPVTSVQIFNMTGQKVGDYSFDKAAFKMANVSLKGLPPGNYIFKINNTTAKTVVKSE